MSTLWDELTPALQNNPIISALQSLLTGVEMPGHTEQVESDGTWRIYSANFGSNKTLAVDTENGGFSAGGTAPSSAKDTAFLEFPNGAAVHCELGLKLTASKDLEGSVRVRVTSLSSILHIPFLRGAVLDDQGQLRADSAHPVVKFFLPALRVQVQVPSGGATSFRLLSANTDGSPVDRIYDFVRMEPPYALIGPGDVVGFGFRSAVLDLSGADDPASGVPAPPVGAAAQPGVWQGLYLPEAKIYVAPDGLEGLAVSGGVRNLWVGIGQSAGVTGLFEAEVVNRGSNPRIRIRFQTSTGRWVGVSDSDPIDTVSLPEHSTMYVDAGSGLAPYSYTITINGAVTHDPHVEVTSPAAGTQAVTVMVSDSAGHSSTRTFSINRSSASGAAATSPPNGAQLSSVNTQTDGSHIVMQAGADQNVTLSIQPSQGAMSWLVNGAPASNSATLDLPVEVGTNVTVSATRLVAAGSPTEVVGYVDYDKPDALPDEAQLTAFALNPANVSAEPRPSSVPFIGSVGYELVRQLPMGTNLQIDGFASYENDDSTQKRNYNIHLSERRIKVMQAIFANAGRNFQFSPITASQMHGHTDAKADAGARPGSFWRKARLEVPTSVQTYQATVSRPAALVLPTPAPEHVPTSPRQPDCFRKIGFRIEFLRGTFVRAEVYGEFDVRTATEQRLAANDAGQLPASQNVGDGICNFLLRLKISEDRSSWETKAEFRAAQNDTDGLVQIKHKTGDSTALTLGVNVLGAVSALGPLMAAVTPPSPKAGDLVPLALVGSSIVGLGAAGVIASKQVTLYGGELVVSDGLVDTSNNSGPHTTQASIMVDVETALTFDLGIIKVKEDQPIKARYKAMGLRSTWKTQNNGAGQVEYIPLPVFDPSRGYTLDVPAGALVATPPLDNLLRILGVRVSRDNPTYLEVEVGMGVDLGPLTIDTARVRLRLDQAETPQLTKLGASLEIPGTLHGRGTVEITSDGFKGAFDLTIQPLNVRGSAQLALESREGVTGVLIGIEVAFPVPIPLGGLGLGLYGLLGGVGVNYQRIEKTDVQTPALEWLSDQLSPLRNSVMHPDGWALTPGAFAVAAGVLIGTTEGGFVMHLKGIVMIEVPGPRLLIMMKADVIKMPPALKGQTSATFLAVLDLDFGRGTITIGVIAEYDVQKLLHIRVPLVAFFDTNQLTHWFVDLGNFDSLVTVKILDVFNGTGYLMVHGDGITHPRLPIVSKGLTIALGFHLQATLMGSRAVGLYLEAAAGFDVIVSFKPFGMGGLIYVRGELRLFIVSISASAELTVLVGRQLDNGVEKDRTYVYGEVCGEVHFFFFKVKGCVSLTIGDEFTPEHKPPPLVSGVKLVSRSPALLEGSGADRALDGVLADAVGTDVSELPSVPLDAVPVIFFDHVPYVDNGNVILGGVANGSSGAEAEQWAQFGDEWWRFKIIKVELIGSLQPPTGLTPATWWKRGIPQPDKPPQNPALALLSWLPTPVSRAVPYGQQLINTITEQWESVCKIVAEPAYVLWTFDQQPQGASSVGWSLPGIAWPDGAGTYRSDLPQDKLQVTELWRTGDAGVDLLQGTQPASVWGDAVTCPTQQAVPNELLTQWVGDPLKHWLQEQPTSASRFALPQGRSGLQQMAEILANGTTPMDALNSWRRTAWDPEVQGVTTGSGFIPTMACQGRILRSPKGDTGEPAPMGTDADIAILKRAWKKNKFTPSPLNDTLRLAHPSGWQALRVLLLVPANWVKTEAMVCLIRDASSNILDTRVVKASDVVNAQHPLPARWLDRSGPWSNSVERAGSMAGRVAAMEAGTGAVLAVTRVNRMPSLVLVLIDFKLPKENVSVDIGYKRDLTNEIAPAFWMVAAEGLTLAEVRRSSYDANSLQQDRAALQTALVQDPDDHALLVPGEQYTVRVTWASQSVKQTNKPQNVPDAYVLQPTQEFRFKADGQDKAPKDLTPWILATAPSMGDTGIFCKTPVRIALATQKLAALFDAYNQELRVIVRAASGKHPVPPGGGVAGAPVKVPLTLSGILKDAPGLRVMTPWQQAATKMAKTTLPCINASGSRTYHSVIEIGYVLEPLTDYILDVLSVPKGSPSSTQGVRIFRANFTTSRFDQVDDLAALLLYASVEHALVVNPAAIQALPDTPAGAVLDAAFQSAGLSPPQVPRYPRIQVLWSGDAIPQPVALVVECSEMLWRTRLMPTLVNGWVDAADPLHQWWAAKLTDWLHFDASVSPPPAGDLPRATVQRVIRGAGMTRAIVLLGSGARGKSLALDLTLTGDALANAPPSVSPAVRVNLISAPWEEEL